MHRRWLSGDAADRVGRAEVPAFRGPLVLGERDPLVDDRGAGAEILSELRGSELATKLGVAARLYDFEQGQAALAELCRDTADSGESRVRLQSHLDSGIVFVAG